MAVHVIDTIKPKNNLNFPVVEAIDISVEGYENLAVALNSKADQSSLDSLGLVVQNGCLCIMYESEE